MRKDLLSLTCLINFLKSLSLITFKKSLINLLRNVFIKLPNKVSLQQKKNLTIFGTQHATKNNFLVLYIQDSILFLKITTIQPIQESISVINRD